LYSIDADVDPAAFFGLAGNNAIGSTDITATVQFMPVRRRKDRHVDVAAGLDVFRYRAVFDYPRRHGLYTLEQFFPLGDKFDRLGIGGHADGEA
jgi:hypothetical protein